ncbi:MAG: hypothetical protein NC350_03650 [Corallococcus sp.]|nr:hypothetical protein [Corallococcus sp.]
MDILNNLNKNNLSKNLHTISLFIAIYECMTEFVKSNVQAFFCNGFHTVDGKVEMKYSREYYTKIKNRIVDEKGNKDELKASFLFLQDNGIISKEDYDFFLEAKQIRNKFTHEMLETIFQGVEKKHIKLLYQMVDLFKMMTNKWFVEIEAPTSGIDLSNGVDVDNICLGTNAIFDFILTQLDYRKENKK